MKTLKLIAALLCCIGISKNAHAQDQVFSIDSTGSMSSPSGKTYYCWIYGDTAFAFKVQKAFIKSVLDSDIVFNISEQGNSFTKRNKVLTLQNVTNIEQLKIRRKGSVGKGMLIGAGIGFFVGGVLGLAHIPDYGILVTLSAEENAAAGGVVFSIPGLVIGGLIGSLRVKIPIHKNQQQYEQYKKLIARYASNKM